MSDPENASAMAAIGPVISLACGCLCDDLRVTTRGETIAQVENGCKDARAWFLRDRAGEEGLPVAEVAGRPAAMTEAVAKAAALLAAARAPVIVGLSGSTNQTVAAAVRLADELGAVIDPGDGPGPAARHLALARTGRVSATLGEVRDRADVVVFWGTDPLRTQLRHLARVSVEPAGRFVPDGRAGRTVVVVDDRRTANAEQADRFVAIDRAREFEVLWTLRALVKGLDLDGRRVMASTGVALETLKELADLLRGAHYGALFHAPRDEGRTLAASAATIEAAQGLVRELNRQTRFVILGMGEPGNAAGAEAVLTWQSGFPVAVDFGPGYPVSVPGSTSARERLARGEADAALVVGSAGIGLMDGLSPGLPVIVVAPPTDGTLDPHSVAVRCRAATPGLDEAGTVHRLDGVALPLRPVRASRFPTERQWLEAIADRVRASREAKGP